MEQYVGLDVSLEQTSLCVVDSSGAALWQGKCISVNQSRRVRAGVPPRFSPPTRWCGTAYEE
jgi:hypothetical protein